jgi:hypothetical protein
MSFSPLYKNPAIFHPKSMSHGPENYMPDPNRSVELDFFVCLKATEPLN